MVVHVEKIDLVADKCLIAVPPTDPFFAEFLKEYNYLKSFLMNTSRNLLEKEHSEAFAVNTAAENLLSSFNNDDSAKVLLEKLKYLSSAIKNFLEEDTLDVAVNSTKLTALLGALITVIASKDFTPVENARLGVLLGQLNDKLEGFENTSFNSNLLFSNTVGSKRYIEVISEINEEIDKVTAELKEKRKRFDNIFSTLTSIIANLDLIIMDQSYKIREFLSKLNREVLILAQESAFDTGAVEILQSISGKINLATDDWEEILIKKRTELFKNAIVNLEDSIKDVKAGLLELKRLQTTSERVSRLLSIADGLLNVAATVIG